MAPRHDKDQEQPKSSLKEEIIQKIRQQEEMQRDSGGGTYTSPRATAVAIEQRSVSETPKAFSLFRPGIRTMAVYCRQLATLVDVGIPLLRSLQILAERSSHRKLRSVSADLATRVEEGQPLSSAMLAHPKVFSPMFVGVVSAGEAGGILDESLRRLADLLERRAEIRRRVISALIYPLVALIVELIVIGIIVFYALPKLLLAYPRRDLLPEPTVILLNISEWMQTNWPALLILIVALIVILFFIFSLPKGRAAWDRAVLYLPVFGKLSRKINVSRFTRTLGNLTSAGIPLIDALTITARTSDNAVVEKTLLNVRNNVEAGGKMEEPMRREPRVFDPIIVDMVMVGDEAGALDTMLLKIADTYDAEVDSTLKTLTSILEPMLIVFLGLVVGFIAIAVFLPYVRLARNPALMGE